MESEDALFNAYTTSDAEELGDEGDLVGRFDLNAQLSCSTPSEFEWFDWNKSYPFSRQDMTATPINECPKSKRSTVTNLLAFLRASLRLAPVRVDDGYTGDFVGHGLR